MKKRAVISLGALGLGLILQTGCVVAAGPPPHPYQPAVVYGPAPYPGPIWINGGWFWHSYDRRWEYHPGHWARRR